MTIEVNQAVPRVGELRAVDIRRGTAGRLRGGDVVEVIVLAEPRGVPYVGGVELVERRAGRGRHLVLRCPSCGAGKERLVVCSGHLQCGPCAGRLTRRQAERTTRSFCREGGREEDSLLRLLMRPGPPTSGRLAQARALKHDLDAIDEDRVEQLLRDVDGLVELAGEGVSG